MAAALLLTAALAHAQDYPSRPVRLIVPYPPGGPVDIMGRLTGQKLGELLGVQVVVDNRAGANGNIAGEIAARSNPDGYTLLMGANGNIAVNPSLYRRMPFDPQKELAPISLVGTGPLMMVVHPSVPAQSVADFIGLAKSKPGGINFASSGSGSTAHLCSELLKSMAQIEIVHVPYKGAGPALNDVIGGQVQMLITGVSSALPHVRSGKLRALGVTTKARSAVLPEVATLHEQGLTDFEDVTWNGLVAPAGTPREVLLKLHGAVAKAMGNEGFTRKYLERGIELLASRSPEDFSAYVKSEAEAFTRLVREAGIKVE